MRKLAYLLPLFFIFSGCASKIAPGPYGKYSTPEVRFYEESDLKGKDVTNLGEIKGVDCGLTWWRISSSDNALAALIKEAKTKGANGVRSTVCEDTGMRVSPCQNSATCKGEAILIK